jgi:L-rhamnose mutarotase
MIEHGIGDQVRWFAVWEVTDILQLDAAITSRDGMRQEWWDSSADLR